MKLINIKIIFGLLEIKNKIINRLSYFLVIYFFYVFNIVFLLRILVIVMQVSRSITVKPLCSLILVHHVSLFNINDKT